MAPDFLLTLVTDLGDSGLLGALVLTLSAYLASQGRKKEALIFLGVWMGTGIAIALLKVLTMGCGSLLWQHGIRSPSGHAAMSFAVYGMLGALLARQCSKSLHLSIQLSTIIIALCVAVSRVLLKHHTAGEVVIGAVVGALAFYTGQRFLPKGGEIKKGSKGVIVITLLVVILAHGAHLPAEQIIQLLASYFRKIADCKA